METINRQISGLSSQSQRIQARKTDMTNFMNSIVATTRLKMGLILDAIAQRIRATISIPFN